MDACNESAARSSQDQLVEQTRCLQRIRQQEPKKTGSTLRRNTCARASSGIYFSTPKRHSLCLTDGPSTNCSARAASRESSGLAKVFKSELRALITNEKAQNNRAEWISWQTLMILSLLRVLDTALGVRAREGSCAITQGPLSLSWCCFHMAQTRTSASRSEINLLFVAHAKT